MLHEVGGGMEPPIKQIVLSAENLSNPMGWHNLFVPVSEKYELEVVLYVRRQDDFLLSACTALVLQASLTTSGGWLTRCVGVMGNWRLSLAGMGKSRSRLG